MTKRPHDEIIGCEPAGERSTIERRRWPSANGAPASAKTAPSSGPRWRSVSVIASATATTAAGALFHGRSQMPAIPHISAIPFPDHLPSTSMRLSPLATKLEISDAAVRLGWFDWCCDDPESAPWTSVALAFSDHEI